MLYLYTVYMIRIDMSNEIHSHEHHHDHDHEHSHEHNHGHYHTNTKSVLNRLSRSIGHLTSVRTMVEDGRDCSEVLIQLAAVKSEINGICNVILKDHIDHCVVHAIEDGDKKVLDELNEAIDRFIK